MRRWASWLVAGALTAIVLAATGDVFLRDQARPAPTALPSTTAAPLPARQSEAAARRLREAGVTGVLTFADEKCRLHALSLPELEAVRAPSFEMCRPLTDSGGLGVAAGDVVWAGLGFGFSQEVISTAELTRALRTVRDSVEGGYVATQAVSLGDNRIAVVAGAVDAGRVVQPWERVVVLFDGEELVTVAAALLREGDVVRPSSAGRYFAILSRGEPSLRQPVTLYERSGRAVALPSLTGAHAVAWSPDDRWTAVATTHGVHIFASEQTDEPVIRIPLVVRDLDWGT